MKKLFTAFCLSVFILSPVFAKKPEWAGKDKESIKQSGDVETVIAPQVTDEQVKYSEEKLKKEKSKHKKLMKEKSKQEKSEDLKGLEKQKHNKTEQVQKEMDKGSEKGQKSREQRKKWWQFGGE